MDDAPKPRLDTPDDVAAQAKAIVRKARRPLPTPTQRAERARLRPARVAFIAGLMRELKFRMGHTHDALANAWDLPLGYVGKMAVEASRLVRAELAGDQDHILSKIGAALNWVIDDAVASGDRHAIIKACQVYATVTGAAAPQKVEIGQDLSGLTPEQLAARKADLIARLSSKPIPNPAPLEITVRPRDPEQG